jgi:copper homeostasis protein
MLEELVARAVVDIIYELEEKTKIMIKEACVETFEEALKAEQQGADRIELCSDLKNDGLTPAFKLMQKTCSTLKIPVMVMIRPRPGNFVYSSAEIQIMKQHIDLAKEAQVAGVVLGLLTTGHQIDLENTRILAEYAKPLPVTFHKAIDVTGNPVEGIKLLKEIKAIKRVLTSGGKATAKEGSETIRNMIREAGEEIIILVAGKVTHDNIGEIQQLTGGMEFHGKKIAGDLY